MRRGNTFTGYARADGSPTWIQLTNPVTLSMGATAYVGLAVCASNASASNTAAMDNMTISVP